MPSPAWLLGRGCFGHRAGAVCFRCDSWYALANAFAARSLSSFVILA